jgi:alanyl-tRNA synthetase
MQQHTGQHLLSAVIERRHRVRTLSFHLGSEGATIDLARELTPRELDQSEDDANLVVWENRLVTVRFATAEEASHLSLRKESVRTGVLRLIEIGGVDLSACGGTHVDRTGALGLIAIVGRERFKGGQRLEFLCGGRALERFRLLREITAGSAQLLSSVAGELPASIEKLQTEAREQRRRIAMLQAEMLRYRADEFATEAEIVGDRRLVVRSIDGDAAELKALAAALTARPGYAVALVSSTRPAIVVVARSIDVSVSASDVVAKLTRGFGGRGGGRPEAAQGGGLDAPIDTILEAVRKELA